VLDSLGWGAAVSLHDEVVVGLLDLFGFQVSQPVGLPGSFLARNGGWYTRRRLRPFVLW
jgi:hypothetical protein